MDWIVLTNLKQKEKMMKMCQFCKKNESYGYYNRKGSMKMYVCDQCHEYMGGTVTRTDIKPNIYKNKDLWILDFKTPESNDVINWFSNWKDAVNSLNWYYKHKLVKWDETDRGM